MILYSNCKVNIGLNIVGKREDGYHNLKSIFYPIPLADVLEINQSSTFKFTTSGLPIPGKTKDNLILKAYQLIASKFKIDNCHIHLHKVIPMGAGLGGGSSNAAYTMLGLNQIFELGLSNNQLEEFASKIGADCPFFIQNQPSFVEGKGEVLTPINLELKKYWFKLINPGIHVSTKQAFKGIELKESNLSPVLISELAVSDWKNNISNDFEKSVGAMHPEIISLKESLYNEGAIYSSMTGTGSSIYGIFDTEPVKNKKNNFEYITLL